MKKLKKTIRILVSCAIAIPQLILADVHPKIEEPETRKQEVIAFLKRHKTKIEAAVAVILISYFFGNPPPPPESHPLILNNYWLNQNKYQQFTDYIRLFFYKIRLTYRDMRILIYLIGNHPLLLAEALRNRRDLNIEEIIYGTVKHKVF